MESSCNSSIVGFILVALRRCNVCQCEAARENQLDVTVAVFTDKNNKNQVLTNTTLSFSVIYSQEPKDVKLHVRDLD